MPEQQFDPTKLGKKIEDGGEKKTPTVTTFDPTKLGKKVEEVTPSTVIPKQQPLVPEQPAVTQGQQFAQPSTSNLAGSTSPSTGGASVLPETEDLTQKVQRIVQSVPPQKKEPEFSLTSKVQELKEDQTKRNLMTEMTNEEKSFLSGGTGLRVNPIYKPLDPFQLKDDKEEGLGIDYWTARGVKKQTTGQYETDVIGILQPVNEAGSLQPNSVINVPSETKKVFDDYLKHIASTDPDKFKTFMFLNKNAGKEIHINEITGGKQGAQIPTSLSPFVSEYADKPTRYIKGLDKEQQLGVVMDAIQHQRNILQSDYNYRVKEQGESEDLDKKFLASNQALFDLQKQIIDQNPDFKKAIDKYNQEAETEKKKQERTDLKYEMYHEKSPFFATIYYGLEQPVEKSLKGAVRDVLSAPANLGVTDLSALSKYADKTWKVDDTDTPTELKGSTIDEDGFHFNRLLPNTSGMLTDMFTLIAGGKGIGTVTKLGYKPGLFASSYMNTYNDYHDEALNAGLTQKQADDHARRSAVTTSLLELISPNIGIANGFKSEITERSIKHMAKGVTAGQATTRAIGEYFKELPAEVAQEMAQLLGDKYQQSVANENSGREAFDTETTAPEVAETIFMTGLVTGLANVRNLKSPNSIQKASIYTAATNYQEFIDKLKENVEAGKVSPEEGKIVSESVKEVKSIIDGLPTDKKLNEEQKMDIAEVIFKKKKLAEQEKGAYIDEAFKVTREEEIAKKTARLDKDIQGVLSKYDESQKIKINQDEKETETKAEVLTPEVSPDPEQKAEGEKVTPVVLEPITEVKKDYENELTPTEQKVSDNLKKDLDENYDERKNAYIKKHGLIFDTDRARELSPEYNESPEILSNATQVPSREFVNKMYNEELSKPAPEGKENVVVFTSGGPGVGKTRAIEEMDYNQHITVDTNLSNFDRSIKDIDQALKAGKKVQIAFTHRDPTQAFIHPNSGVISRAKNIGRTVPYDVAVAINEKALKTIIKLSEHYKDNNDVQIEYYENNGDKGDAKQITLEDVKGINVDFKQSKEDIKNEIERQYKAGEFEGGKYSAEKLYAGLIGDKESIKRLVGGVKEKVPEVVSGGTEQEVKPEKKVSAEKETALKELDKAREAFRKKMGGLSSTGPFQAIPELVSLLKAYGKVGYVTVKDAIKQFRSDFPESKITDEDIEKHFEESTKEKLSEKPKKEPKEKERKFAGIVIKDSEVRPEIKEKLKDKTYTEIPNDITLSEAETFIKEHGLEAAENAVYNMNNGMSPRVRIVVGQAVVKALDSMAIKEKDPVVKNDLFNRAASVADELARIGTEYGQGVQAFAVWNNLSVDGMLNIFTRANKKTKKLISEETKNTKKKIKEAVDAGVNRAAKKVAESIKTNPPKGLKKTKAFGLSSEDIAEGKRKALEKIKAARGNLTASGLSKEFIEGALEYGYYVFADGVRTFKEWAKSMKEAGIDGDDLLNDLWNNHPISHGKTLAQLAKVGDLKDIVAENYKSGGNVDTLTEAIAEYFGISQEDSKTISKEIDKRFKEIRNKEVKQAMKEKVNPSSREAKKVAKTISENSELNTEKDIEKEFNKEFGITEETDPKLREKLIELEENRKNAPEGFLKNNVTIDMLSEISKAKGGRAGNIFWSLWYASILSGPETQVLNFVSNATNLVLESGVSAIEQAIIKKDPVAFGKTVGHMVSNLGRGLTEVEAVMKEGPTALAREATKLEAKDSIEDFDFTGGNKNPFNWYKNFLKYVSLRPLASVDTLFYTAANSLASHKKATQIAKDEGLEGQELKDRVDQILGATKQQYEEARIQAEEEVDNFYDSTGKDKNTRKYHRDKARRIYEIIINNQPIDVQEQGESFGKYVTYNYTPKGWIGSVANTLSNLGQIIPPFRMIVPFTRIVANVLNQQLDWTPYGYARAFGVNASAWTHESDKSTSVASDVDQRNRELIKATIGTALMVSLLILAKSYDDDDEKNRFFDVHGKGPADFNKKNQKFEHGWKPYTVQVGDKFISYQYSPFAIALSFVGNWRDNEKYNDLSEKDIMTKMAFAMSNTSSGIMDMSFLTGLSGFMETLTSTGDPEARSEKIMKSLGRTTTSFIPNFFKQIDNIYFDNTVYDTRTVKGAILADIPFVRSHIGAKPKLNVLGENVEKQGNIMRRFFSDKNPDKVWTTLADKKLWIPGAQPGTKKLNGEPMTDDEYYDYVKISGGYMRKWLEENIEKVESMEPDIAQKVITKVMGVQRKRAKVEISLRENEEIKAEDVNIEE